MASKGERHRSGAVGKQHGLHGTGSLSTASYQSLRPQSVTSSSARPSKVQWRSYQPEDFSKKARQVEEQIYTLENRHEDDLLFSHTRSRRTSLLGYDMAQLVVEYLSILALLLSLSLRWTWPDNWIKAMGWIFLFNLDIFEFSKVYTPNVYTSVQGGYTASTSVPVHFWGQMVLWAIVTFILAVTFLGIFLYLWKKRSPRYYIQTARLRRAYLLITQFLALPFGVSLGKIFHCTSTNTLDVDNSVVCWGGAHWAYLVVAIIAAAAFYFLIPAYMIYRTDRQIVSLTDEKHESYLRLKEHEYKRGLDALWYISEFFLFSSFRRVGVFYRPVIHLMKLVFVGIYAALFNSMQLQSALLCVILFLMAVIFAFVRPYRVTLLNVYLVLCYACLGSCALMGALRSSFTSFTVATVFLLPDYTTGVLGMINGAWLVATIGFVAFMIRRRQQMWPRLMIEGDDPSKPSAAQDASTRKYVKAVLRSKAVIEYAVSMPPMFAPVHELSRQVLLVNALFREAEASKDPMQDTLWDILEELSQLHARLLPRSLFAESVKPSVRRTAAEFLAIMPQLARRLHQREYDFIMTHPVRRRILFKLYALSVFLRGSREAREREYRVNERVGKVWQSNREQDDVYYPSLYPELEEGPSVLTVSMPVARELRKDDDRREMELHAVSNSLVDLTAADDESPTVVVHQSEPDPGSGVVNEAFEDNEGNLTDAPVGERGSENVEPNDKPADELPGDPFHEGSNPVPASRESPRAKTEGNVNGDQVPSTSADEQGEGVIPVLPETAQSSPEENLINLDGMPSERNGNDVRSESSLSAKKSPREPVLVEIGGTSSAEKDDKALAPLE